MITIEKVVTPSPAQWGIVIEGMRNPHDSWDKIDSYSTYIEDADTLQTADFEFFMGDADKTLAKSLVAGGPVHAKFRRMLPVIFTASAPAFLWPEIDTYKVGTSRNSCSKMHRIHVEPLKLENFSHEGCKEIPLALEHLEGTLTLLNVLREKFNETKDKKFWRALIELLPHGYNMTATLSVNYEVLANIYKWRKNHKLDEWREFCRWIESLPYAELITGEEK